jgi:hypothetical protein
MPRLRRRAGGIADSDRAGAGGCREVAGWQPHQTCTHPFGDGAVVGEVVAVRMLRCYRRKPGDDVARRHQVAVREGDGDGVVW